MLNSKRPGRRKIYSFGIIFFAVFLTVFLCMLEKADIYGDSMYPYLLDGDCVLVEKFSYLMDEPRRFDVVIFRYPYDEKRFYAKRIIGLPEETVQIVDGEIYINGEKLEEPETSEKILDPGRANEPIILGSDEYFLLGDNRNNSADSRHSDIGNIKRNDLAGKVFWCFPRKER